MRVQSRIIALPVAVAALVAVAACSDRPSSGVTAPTLTKPNAAVGFLTLSCDINALKSNARTFSASNRDPLITIVGDLQGLVKNGPTALGTDKAFDGLARLAAMRGTSDVSSSATGTLFNALTLGFFGCMESYVSTKVPDDFTVAGALGKGWMYEVRGKSTDAATGAYEKGSGNPYWGAEGPNGWSVATSSTAKRFLIYGYRIGNFLPNDPLIGSAFEIRTVPAIHAGLELASSLTIGVCNVELTNTLRLQHVTTVLKKVELTGCTTIAPQLSVSTQQPLRMLAQRAVGLFAPQPLYAAAFFAGSVGGAPSELSPSKIIDMQSVTLAFAANIADGRVSDALKGLDGNDVAVRVTTLGGTPLPGVDVTLAIAGNSSSIAYFMDGTASVMTVTRTTLADGYATFSGVSLTKAGGYTLQATGAFDGVGGTPIPSNSFNIQNK